MPAGDGYVDVIRTNPASTHAGFVVRQVGIPSASAAADASENPTTIPLYAHMLQWNNTGWDRYRANMNITGFASASRTATAETAAIVNYNHRGLHAVIDPTTIGGAVLTMRIQAQDAEGTSWYTVATGASLSANGASVLKLYPGISAGAASINDVLPRTFRITVIPTGSVTATYSVGLSLIV